MKEEQNPSSSGRSGHLQILTRDQSKFDAPRLSQNTLHHRRAARSISQLSQQCTQTSIHSPPIMPGKRGSRLIADIQAVDTEHSIFKNSNTPRKPLQSIDSNQQRTAPPPAKKRKSNDGIEIKVDEALPKMYLTPPASQPLAKPKVQRTVKKLPGFTLDVTAMSLEEGLYSGAIALHSRSLESGLETDAPARVPHPQHLALESTLTVHPTFNTKTIKFS